MKQAEIKKTIKRTSTKESPEPLGAVASSSIRVNQGKTLEHKDVYQTLASMRVSVKAHIESAYRVGNGLLICGWVFDPDGLVTGLGLYDKNTKSASHIFYDDEAGCRFCRLSRPDVSAGYPGVLTDGDDHGFLAYLPINRSELPQFALTLKSGALAVVEHPLDRNAQEAARHLRPGLRILAGPLRALAVQIAEVGDFVNQYLVLPPEPEELDFEPGLGLTRTFDRDAHVRKPLTEVAQSIKINIELALSISKGVLIVGYVWDPKHAIRDWGLAEDAGRTGYVAAAGHKQGTFFRRTLRPDVVIAFGGDRRDGDWCGFVLFVSGERKNFDTLVVRAATGETIMLPLAVSSDVWGSWETMETIWAHSGTAIRQLAKAALPERHAFRDWLEDFVAVQLNKGGAPLAVVEKAIIAEDAILLLEGWMGLANDEITSLELWQGSEHQNLSQSLIRTMRPDVASTLGLPPEAQPGYISASKINRDMQGSYRLKLKAKDGRLQIVFLRPTSVDLHFLMPTLVSAWDDAKQIQTHIAELTRGTDVAQRMGQLYAQAFAVRCKALPAFIDHPLLGAAAIDRTIVLRENGLLIFGWSFSSQLAPPAATLHTPEGGMFEITDRLFRLPRSDVKQSYIGRIPQVPEYCGFVVHVPLPTAPGELRMLEFDFGEVGKLWLKIPTDRTNADGVAVVKEILQWIPSPERLGPRLSTLLGNCIGPAVEGLIGTRKISDAVLPVERQFGNRSKKPTTSIIVPLYGRCDFLRHQVAHFAADPGFADVDLIYVLDDPAIEHETLFTAGRVHALFGLAFRVITYACNLGFGPANNVGAQFALAPNLILLNSDVLPTAPGWVAGLEQALKSLRGAKAVAPLLLFHDGMVQHAGMTSGPCVDFDGLLANRHPGKGLPWTGGDTPYKSDLLSAACVMVRTEEYRKIGGFDESFIVGDFEDSDLCRRLVGKGDALYMVPKFKLWHLERQSQAIGVNMSQRMLITLLNGMRYSKRQAARKEI